MLLLPHRDAARFCCRLPCTKLACPCPPCTAAGPDSGAVWPAGLGAAAAGGADARGRCCTRAAAAARARGRAAVACIHPRLGCQVDAISPRCVAAAEPCKLAVSEDREARRRRAARAQQWRRRGRRRPTTGRNRRPLPALERLLWTFISAWATVPRTCKQRGRRRERVNSTPPRNANDVQFASAVCTQLPASSPSLHVLHSNHRLPSLSRRTARAPTQLPPRSAAPGCPSPLGRTARMRERRALQAAMLLLAPLLLAAVCRAGAPPLHRCGR